MSKDPFLTPKTDAEKQKNLRFIKFAMISTLPITFMGLGVGLGNWLYAAGMAGAEGILFYLTYPHIKKSMKVTPPSPSPSKPQSEQL